MDIEELTKKLNEEKIHNLHDIPGLYDERGVPNLNQDEEGLKKTIEGLKKYIEIQETMKRYLFEGEDFQLLDPNKVTTDDFKTAQELLKIFEQQLDINKMLKKL